MTHISLTFVLFLLQNMTGRKVGSYIKVATLLAYHREIVTRTTVKNNNRIPALEVSNK